MREIVDKESLVIVTNGFSKKSQKTPDQEIALAEQRKKNIREGKKAWMSYRHVLMSIKLWILSLRSH